MSRPRSLHSIQDAELATINMLVYGFPGTGKTPFWGTGGARLILLDSDNGYESAIAAGSTAKRFPATTYGDMEEIYEYLRHDICKGGPEAMDSFEFNWVVWDSLTLFQDRTLIDELTSDANAENPNQPRWVPSKREYFVDHNRIGDLVRRFVALPINFGISCHVMMDSDPQEGTTLWMPAIQGKNMSSKVSGYMNVIGLLGLADVKLRGKTEKVKRPRLLTQQEGKLYARDRFGRLGHHVDNPTVPKITELIEAGRGERSPSAATPIRRRRRRTA